MFALLSIAIRGLNERNRAEPARLDNDDVRPLSFGELLAASFCQECCVVPFDMLLRHDNRDIAAHGANHAGLR